LAVARGGTNASTTSAKYVFIGPTNTSGAPSFRALVASDIPSLDMSVISTGILPVSQGGIGTTQANANVVFAGPASGDATAPDFRTLVAADIPKLSITSKTSGTLTVARGGTGLTKTSPKYVFIGPASGDATAAPTWRALVASDLPSHSTELLTEGILPIVRGGTGISTITKNYALLGPTNANGAPTWRALDSSDIPTLDIGTKTSGTLAVNRGGTGLTSTTAKYVFIGPTNSAGAPTWRALVESDIPTLNANKITTGTLAIAQGGTGLSTTSPNYALLGPSSGTAVGAPTWRKLVSADIPELNTSKLTGGILG